MIKKVKGAISLPNGEILGGDLEIEEQPVLSDEQATEQTWKFNEIIKEAQQRVIHILLDRDRPTGPVVDSTLAKKGEESNG